MLTYRDAKTGRTQQVHERETVKRAVLERIGWRLVEPEPPQEPAKPARTQRRRKKADDESVAE